MTIDELFDKAEEAIASQTAVAMERAAAYSKLIELRLTERTITQFNSL